MTMDETQDVLERVRRYAPTAVSVGREWSVAQDAELLARLTRGAADAGVIPLHFVPTPAASRGGRWGRMLPVAASAAVLAVAAGGLIALLPGSGGDGPGGRVSGPVFDPPAGLSAQPDVGPHQVGYRLTQNVSLNSSGRAVPGETLRVWIKPDGRVRRSGAPVNGCRWSKPPGVASLEEPTAAFFARLPVDIAELGAYLRSHVQGSSSHDEAVFVAVGDALREGDGLASPRLRAAMVAVLSRTPGVAPHPDDHDYLGRPALRLDFVDQRIRPNEVQSLYFDPKTFHLVEQSDARNGEPPRYTGPSPAYEGHGQVGRDPERLRGPADIAVVRVDQVLAEAPTGCR